MIELGFYRAIVSRRDIPLAMIKKRMFISANLLLYESQVNNTISYVNSLLKSSGKFVHYAPI